MSVPHSQNNDKPISNKNKIMCKKNLQWKVNYNKSYQSGLILNIEFSAYQIVLVNNNIC